MNHVINRTEGGNAALFYYENLFIKFLNTLKIREIFKL